jgi:hypothetical protein
MKNVDFPGLGRMVHDPQESTYTSEPIPLKVLGGELRRIIVEEYEMDPQKADFHIAISNFLSIDPSELRKASGAVFSYYKDCVKSRGKDDESYVRVVSADDVWKHIKFGEPIVTRRPYGDKGIYVSIFCDCDWEREHGMQVVFKNGAAINKVGQIDGHLTNADAFSDPALENVVYHP